jgi:hypothetical protein
MASLYRPALLCLLGIGLVAADPTLAGERHGRSANLPSPTTAPIPPGEVLDIEADGEPLGGPAPLTVKFTVTAGEDAAPPSRNVVYTWNFDDGTTATGPAPVHTFRRHGMYLVKVEARDGKRRGETFANVRAWTPEEWNTSDPAVRQKAATKNIRLLERRTGQVLPPEVRKKWGLPAKPPAGTP